jgi:hypothetical protein
MYSIFWPAISFGSNAIVFFSGIPNDAAGPVADKVTPILTSAKACELTTEETLATNTAVEIQRKTDFIDMPRKGVLSTGAILRFLYPDHAVGESRV